MKRLPFFRRPFFASRILEVGGGHAPYDGVTHAVDKYPDDNTQRATDLVVPAGVEFRQGDLESIPFASNEEFDFCYASHVLEHVADPKKAVSELNRVSKQGYIETPSPLREQLVCVVPFDPKADFHTLFAWTTREANTLHVALKSDLTVNQFCECRNGKMARALSLMQRSRGIDLEPLLPREAKTTQLFFKRPVALKQHTDLTAACAVGSCAYDSVRAARKWATPPFMFYSPAFARLRAVLAECEVMTLASR